MYVLWIEKGVKVLSNRVCCLIMSNMEILLYGTNNFIGTNLC